MKKVILSLAAVFAFGFASAQDLTSKKGEPYLPQAGDWSIGFDAKQPLEYFGNLFNSSAVAPKFKGQEGFETPNTPTTLAFVGKQFVTDTYATRYIANFNLNFTKPDSGDGVTDFGLLLGMGKEWRKGSTRLQGFYGADALVGFGFSGKKGVVDAAGNPVLDASSGKQVMKDSSTGFKLGAQGFIGAEYFILPKMAIGAQYTYGVFFNYNADKSMNFNIGGSQTNPGVGTASVLLNLYF